MIRVGFLIRKFEHGAHINKVKDKNTIYLIPMCATHNTQRHNAKQFLPENTIIHLDIEEYDPENENPLIYFDTGKPDPEPFYLEVGQFFLNKSANKLLLDEDEVKP